MKETKNMTTLQEHLNEKYPTKKDKETVKEIKINSKNPLKKIDGGELVLKDFPNLQEVWINWSFLKTPLTKWEVNNCPKLDFFILLSSYSQSWKKDKYQTKIDLFTAKGQKTKQRKKELKGYE